MAMLCGVVGAMSAFYHDDLDINDPAQRQRSAKRLVAKMPTIAAMVTNTALVSHLFIPKTTYLTQKTS